MRHLLPLLALTGCPSQGVLVQDDTPTPREPVTAVVLGDMFQTAYPEGWGQPQAADMDSDGVLDLVAMTDDGGLGWLRGDGRGNFESSMLLSPQAVQSRVVDAATGTSDPTGRAYIDTFELVDIDGDGFVDVQLSVQIREEGLVRTFSGVLFSPLVLAAWQTWTESNNHRVTTVADLDGDGRVEWVEFSETSAIHTSSGDIWPLSDAVSWTYYPHVGVLDINGETLFVVMVDGGFGISQIESWAVTPSGLEPRPSVDGIFAQDVAFGTDRWSVAQENVMVSHDGINRFDGTAIVPAVQPGEELNFFNASMGDFTGDGRLDVLIADGTNPGRLHASSPAGELVDMPFTSPLIPGYGLVVVDINGDGLDDLVQTSWENDATVLRVWMNES